jgi:exodeoxyribonuclease V gamma subunit
MSLNVYISNDLDRLVSRISDNANPRDRNVFDVEHLIVQTEGLRRWLSVQRAINGGIFSNFNFSSPNNLIFELFNLAEMKTPDVYSTNNIKWLIFNILNEDEFKSLWPQVATYYSGDNIRQLQLATRLSDLFDQYTFYRPDYILNWNSDIDNKIHWKYQYHQQWQKWIWNRIKQLLNGEFPDKVELFVSLLKAIRGDEKLKIRIKQKFPKISVFGFSSISQLHINVLVEMSKNTSDIDFYLFNPSPEEYWLHDIPEKTKLKIERYYKNLTLGLNLEVGNRLLMDLGKTARYFYLMIFNNEEFLNNLDNESLVNEPKRDSLLQALQNDIYHNVVDENRQIIPNEIINDGSLTITSHYSIGREIEALYNYLLNVFDDNSIKPRDIIVQTENIDKYVPFIISVFENAEHKIPYNIADRSYHGADNLIGILEKLLKINEEEFTSEEIFQLIQLKPIQSKFGINNTEIVRIIIDKANIRTGIYGEIEDETYIVSWKNGLERIILGYAINSDELVTVPNHTHKNLPLAFIENEFASEGIKLKGFVNSLIENIRQRKINRSLNQWKEFFQNMMNEFFDFDDNDIELINYINDRLSFPEEIENFSGNNISYDIFVSAFIESIYQDTRKGSFITGGVTFCSMTPMRSIPFRVVAVLGLDYISFPRKNKDVLFDLMNAEHRPGDRNIKDSDKFLFLEALMSARDKLYLSYIGQDSKTNVEKPASIVIDSLIDYIFFFENDQKKKKDFIIRHPLHNFNTKYIDSEYPQLYTYNKTQNIDIDHYFQNTENKNDVPDTMIISTPDLLLFYKNSIEFYFKKILKIDYSENEVLIPEAELFESDNLQKSILRINLLEFNDKSDIESFILKEKIRGNLPLKSSGIIETENLISEIDQLKSEFHRLTTGIAAKKISIELKLENDITITGSLDNIFDDKLIIVNFSKSMAKRYVQFQITRILLSITNPEIKNFIFLSYKSNITEIISLSPYDKIIALQKLHSLIEIFNNHQDRIFIFTADAAEEMYRYRRSTRAQKQPEEYFIKNIELKSQNDQYLKKFIELNDMETVQKNLAKPENPIHNLLQLFFEDLH